MIALFNDLVKKDESSEKPRRIKLMQSKHLKVAQSDTAMNIYEVTV